MIPTAESLMNKNTKDTAANTRNRALIGTEKPAGVVRGTPNAKIRKNTPNMAATARCIVSTYVLMTTLAVPDAQVSPWLSTELVVGVAPALPTLTASGLTVL